MFKIWKFKKIQILLSIDKSGYRYFSIQYRNMNIIIIRNKCKEPIFPNRWKFGKIQILLETRESGYGYFSIWYGKMQIMIVRNG